MRNIEETTGKDVGRLRMQPTKIGVKARENGDLTNLTKPK
jgi:hypothetical protein